ncbi:MAG: primosomal protein N' [Bacillota bacterium]
MEAIAEVAVDLRLPALKLYHYRVPESISVQPGQRVLVPFGGRVVQGYVVGLPETAGVADLKYIIGPVEEEPALSPAAISVARVMADHYIASVSDTVRCFAQPGAGQKDDPLITLESEPEEALRAADLLPASQRRVLEFIIDAGGQCTLKELVRELGKNHLGALRALRQSGMVSKSTSLRQKVSEKRTRVFSAVAGTEHLQALRRSAPRQAQVLEILCLEGEMTAQELNARAGECRGVVRALIQKGYVRESSVRDFRTPSAPRWGSGLLPSLTPEQSEACRVISRADRPVLLFGVTGSGKTEVYQRAVEDTIAAGKSAIMLVPEISLTPQMVRALTSRFGKEVAVLHSMLSAGERYDEWTRARQGRARVVVGARSAVFAAVPRLGLVVVDEEHETTYKQSSVPRYHAREVAIWRARHEGARVVLGSATPSLESYYRATKGEYSAVFMRTRVDARPFPAVSVVDMRGERPKSGIIGSTLRDALAETLSAGGQAILFLNRRGFSTFVLCTECGYSTRCPYCSVSLVYHKARGKLACHYCGFERAVPDICPNCAGPGMRFLGFGTQRAEEEVRALFPSARVLRMDVDTTGTRGSHQRILERFENREADILIGTQMVAKGLDIPGVTLVGVLSADTSLNLPDFRAAERTFCLLVQVAGRAGRGDELGRVIIQSYNPEHYSVKAAANHDYDTFYTEELINRQTAGFPPFARVISIVVGATSDRRAEAWTRRITELLRDKGVEVLGPVPAPIWQIRGRYRWMLLARGPLDADIAGPVREVVESAERHTSAHDVSLTVDVDPLNLM